MASKDVTNASADPAALGLVAFGLTTVLLSLINAGVLPKGGEPVVIPLALAFGGLMQIFAGAFEFRLANTFGMTAFLSYGAFWWWFALLLLFSGNHLIDISAAGPTVGAALLLWGVLTLYLWVSTFRLPVIHLNDSKSALGSRMRRVRIASASHVADAKQSSSVSAVTPERYRAGRGARATPRSAASPGSPSRCRPGRRRT